MPGILGYFGNEEFDNLANDMKTLLSHKKTWFDEIIFSHPLGFHGISDFKSNLDSCAKNLEERSIVVYGNIYSYKNKSIGGDKAEELLDFYKKDGIDFIKYLNGSFIFSIYDNGKIFLANDKLGSKNLFYNANNDELLYSSEIKGILTSDSIKPILNNYAVSEFLTFTYLLENRTFFKDITLLPAGSVLVFDDNKLKIEKYYDLAVKRETRENFNLNELITKFSRIFENAVKQRIQDKKRIGIFLSGGLDSRLLAGFAKKISQNLDIELKSFTFGTKGGRQEKIAKKIAKILNIENTFYEIPSNSIAEYAEETVYNGDGLTRIRDAHFISLLKEFREEVDTVLLGFFCSELFGETLIRDLNVLSTKSDLANYLFKLYHLTKVSKYKTSIFSDNFSLISEKKIKDTFIKTLEDIPLESFNEIAHHWEILQRCRRYIIPLANYISWYMEPRLPYLDENVVDFALRLPINLRLNKRFIHKVIRYLFPSLSNVVWEKTGLPVDSSPILENIFKIKRYFMDKLKAIIQSISQNKILFRDLDYRAYAYILRSDSKEFVFRTLLGNKDEKMWNYEKINQIVKEHMNLKKNNELILCDILQIKILNDLFF
jgi:asparagine synthase (glutamine-hydrolysing)